MTVAAQRCVSASDGRGDDGGGDDGGGGGAAAADDEKRRTTACVAAGRGREGWHWQRLHSLHVDDRQPSGGVLGGQPTFSTCGTTA